MTPIQSTTDGSAGSNPCEVSRSPRSSPAAKSHVTYCTRPLGRKEFRRMMAVFSAWVSGLSTS